MPRVASAGCMSAKRFVGRCPALSPRNSTRKDAAELVMVNRPMAIAAASVKRIDFMVRALDFSCAGVIELLLGRWFENQLREIVEPLLPMLEVVGVVIHVPDVRDVLFLQVGVNTLTDA